MIDREQIENWDANYATHQCFEPSESNAPRAVSEHGIAVCKVCGKAESELGDDACYADIAGLSYY